MLGNELQGQKERKYFLVFDPEKGDFEKVFFRENEERDLQTSTPGESPSSDTDSDRSSKGISIIRRPGCVTIEVFSIGRRDKVCTD